MRLVSTGTVRLSEPGLAASHTAGGYCPLRHPVRLPGPRDSAGRGSSSADGSSCVSARKQTGSAVLGPSAPGHPEPGPARTYVPLSLCPVRRRVPSLGSAWGAPGRRSWLRYLRPRTPAPVFPVVNIWASGGPRGRAGLTLSLPRVRPNERRRGAASRPPAAGSAVTSPEPVLPQLGSRAPGNQRAHGAPCWQPGCGLEAGTAQRRWHSSAL